jgi:hypothetical protein
MQVRLIATSSFARRRPRLERLEDRAVPAIAFAVGAGPGAAPQVNVYDHTGARVRSFLAYEPDFRGGVHVATGDVTGDGVGTNPSIEFLAFDPAFRGGVFVG